MTVSSPAVKILYPACLFALFLVLSVTSALKNSPTVDEVSHHIPSGYVYLTKGDLRFATDSPPLARYIAALPLITLNMNLPDERSFWAREDRGEFGREFLYVINNNADKAVFLARLMIIIFTAAGGLFLFYWVYANVSKQAAFIASFFYFLSPNIIAHAGLATTDALVTVFTMISALLFWSFLNDKNIKNAVYCGVFTGLALLTKYSALVLLPAYTVVYAVNSVITGDYVKKRAIFLFTVFLLTAFTVVWAGYGFGTKTFVDGTLRVEEKMDFVSKALDKYMPAFREKGIELVKTVPVPLSSYILGVTGVIKHGRDGGSFFMGKYSEKGNPLYYLLAIAIKTPIPLILLFIAGIFTGLKSRLAFTVYLIFIGASFIVPASLSNLQLGLRYILPVYPMFFILAGMFFDSPGFKPDFLKIIISGAVVIWFLSISVFSWPHYLSYFNGLIGGPANGYKYLRDSNVDWGQGLISLKEYMVNNGIDEVTLRYFGAVDPAYYGIKYADFTERDAEIPDKKVYAVSVNCLDGVKWAQRAGFGGMAGHSIFIYDLRNE